MNQDELYHYGVKGMKWGVRRTPAQLGHKVKSATRKIKAKAEAVSANRKAKKAAKASKTVMSKPKSIKDMTDDELRSLYSRLQLEKNVLETQARISQLSPKQVSKGKRLVESISKEIIIPAVREVGKSYVTEIGKKRLGMTDKDPAAELKRQAEMFKNASQILQYQDQITNRMNNRTKNSTKNSEQRDPDPIPVTEYEVYDPNSRTYQSTSSGSLPTGPRKKRKK